MAAAAGGFVGSVAGQLAGKAMGVVDSFSMKNALASGLTAGATAGMGNILGAGQTFQGAQAAQEASKAGMLGSFATVAKDATVSSLNQCFRVMFSSPVSVAEFVLISMEEQLEFALR